MSSVDEKLRVLSSSYDHVINGHFFVAQADYGFAIDNLVPLIDRLEIQRKIQTPKFYQRLERDILKGCLMPPLTIAFINQDYSVEGREGEAKEYVLGNIGESFVLDGIQRLNTLKRASSHEEFDNNVPIFLNVLVCDSMDSLLYRMITLNNGQKPMTARHQIEILTKNIYDFSFMSGEIQTEKDRSKKSVKGTFDHASFVKAYLAFLSNSTNIDNRKVIEEKLDELIANKILDTEIYNHELDFSEVAALICDLSSSQKLREWFKNENNLIGFSVGIVDSFSEVSKLNKNEFEEVINLFDEAFSYFDISRIKLGQERRKMVSEFFSGFDCYKEMDPLTLMGELSEK